MIHRLVNISKQKSFFLFGARGTGKSYLLDQLFLPDEAVRLDLLDPDLSDRLTAYPERLLEILAPHVGKCSWVVIDEVQKIPKLLDIVHQRIAKRDFHFALTGSSARKLRRGSANMLAGRANHFELFPLTHRELGGEFDLEQVLSFGSLPEPALSTSDIEKQRFLKSYVQTYIREEIVTEQIVRNLPPFRRFLDVAAQGHADVVHYTNIAKDVGSDAKTISNYFEILEDTLIGMRLPAFEKSVRRQQKTSPKFYFFDNGIARTLTGQIDYRVVAKTPEHGRLFEAWLVNEAHRLLTYREKQFRLSFLRIDDDLEIDLIIERARQPLWAIEFKATDRVADYHVAALQKLSKKLGTCRTMLVSNDKTPQTVGGVSCMHWSTFLSELWES